MSNFLLSLARPFILGKCIVIFLNIEKIEIKQNSNFNNLANVMIQLIFFLLQKKNNFVSC